jgi:regulator of protease activity HflC (stomatin/prohibitin superfamily)
MRLRPAVTALTLAAVVSGAAYALYREPPLAAAGRGEIGLRTNRLTGSVEEWREGSVLVLPGLHEARVYSLRDRIYRPAEIAHARGPAPVQSLEGLSLGIDLSVRYAIDPARLRAVAQNLPDDLAREVVEPAVQGAIYKTFARYTVREIFSTKRAEIQEAIEAELRARFAADGLALRGVLLGKVDLPQEYRRGMEALLAEELATEKLRYTLQIRERTAEAQAREQVIAARAQEEAMRHVLPFKQRQIEQRTLEAEADKASRLKQAEAQADARRIEANGEAIARQRLAEAEAYRLQKVGVASSEQMAREGALVTKHPLLIQKALADKLSDKIQVIIAPPGEHFGASLIGGARK